MKLPATAVMVLALLAGCQPVSGFISAEAANAAAVRSVASDGAVRVVSTELVPPAAVVAPPGRTFEPGARVWKVVLEGRFRYPSCGPWSPSNGFTPCPSPATSAVVYLDARTGEFLQGSVPAP